MNAFRNLIGSIAVAFALGCASAGTTASRETGPQLSDPSSHPFFEISSLADLKQFAGRRIDYQVWVSADGVPDATTVRVTGVGTPRIEDAYKAWLANARFKPAMSNGHAVAGLYQGYSIFRVEVR